MDVTFRVGNGSERAFSSEFYGLICYSMEDRTVG